MDIYLNKDGVDLGPFSLEDVRDRLACGEFNGADDAWHEGLLRWVPLNEIASRPPAKSTAQLLPQSIAERPSSIFIIREGTELGPYTVGDINTHLKTGVFTTTDVAKYGSSETLWPLLAVPGIESPNQQLPVALGTKRGAPDLTTTPSPRNERSRKLLYLALTISLLVVTAGITLFVRHRETLKYAVIPHNLEHTDASLAVTPPPTALKAVVTPEQTSHSQIVTTSGGEEPSASSAFSKAEIVRQSPKTTLLGGGPLLEALISICDVYGLTEYQRNGAPIVARDQQNGWCVTLSVKNIRDDQKRADTLGAMAVAVAHEFSEWVNGDAVQCDMLAQDNNGSTVELATASSSNFTPTRKQWLLNEDAFPSSGTHGWAIVGFTSDTSSAKQQDVTPVDTSTALFSIFLAIPSTEQVPKGLNGPSVTFDAERPLLTVYTLDAIKSDHEGVTITLNSKDTITLATITRKYRDSLLILRASDAVFAVERFRGEFIDGQVAFTESATDATICEYLRKRFRLRDDAGAPQSARHEASRKRLARRADRLIHTARIHLNLS